MTTNLESITQLDMFKQLYKDQKRILVNNGETEDAASRKANIYAVRHTREVFGDFQKYFYLV